MTDLPNMKGFEMAHPWQLLACKTFYFPLLYAIYRLPISYKTKMKYKKKLFYDQFTKYARTHFKIFHRISNAENFNIYDLGPFKICIVSNPDFFPLRNLEWNLTHQFFDIVYPAFNPRYFSLILGEGPYEGNNVQCESGDYVIDCGANLGVFTFVASIKVGKKGRVFAIG